MAFVTGSRAYGVPRPADSDIDLVVLVSPADLKRLVKAAQERGAVPQHEGEYISAGGIPLVFGNLNLLVCTHRRQYDVWVKGTQQLKRRKPVSRDEACELFYHLRKEAGYTVNPPTPRPEPGGDDDIPF